MTTGSIAEENQEGRGNNRNKSQEQKSNICKSFNASLKPDGKRGVSMAYQLILTTLSVNAKRAKAQEN